MEHVKTEKIPRTRPPGPPNSEQDSNASQGAYGQQKARPPKNQDQQKAHSSGPTRRDARRS